VKLSIKKISFIPVFSCILLFSLFLTLCTPPDSRIVSLSVPSGKRGDIIRTAEKYIGTRYRYGGSDPRGFDCSGFTSYVFKQHGFVIPRAAGAQFEDGRRVPINRAKPGDLVFFRISGSNISHVGIYAGDFRFIHSPSTGNRVRYDDIRKDYWRTRYAGTVTYFK
jgi:cell wall-associated NlpC family hydrolase